jgi:hypothetical protein
MFSPIFSSKKNLLVKKAFSLLFVLFLVTGAAVFSGCDPDGGDDEDDGKSGFIPEGTWSSTWDGDAGTDVYKIDGNTFSYTSTPTGGTASGWTGTIAGAVDFVPQSSGVLIVEYVKPPEGQYAGHREDHPYTGVYYSEHSASSVKIADAWEPGFSFRAEAKTLDEARKIFTEGNATTHVSMYGTYTK